LQIRKWEENKINPVYAPKEHPVYSKIKNIQRLRKKATHNNSYEFHNKFTGGYYVALIFDNADIL